MRILIALPALFALTAPALSQSCETSAGPWSYEGTTGPACWGAIESSKYKSCGEGKAQSPIDLTATGAKGTGTASKAVQSYRSVGLEIWNNGHAIQMQIPPGLTYTPESGTQFELKQIHFHAPSEHRIDGEAFPLEVHLVHKAEDGRLLVRGVLFREGASHPFLHAALDHKLPDRGDTLKHRAEIDPATLIGGTGGYFEYSGSLTTPGCDEGVLWQIYRTPAEASSAEIEALREHLGFDNARPIQALNGRDVRYVGTE